MASDPHAKAKRAGPRVVDLEDTAADPMNKDMIKAPLDMAILAWHRAMPARLRNETSQKLMALSGASDTGASASGLPTHLTVGTLFSGTDLCCKVTRALADFWANEYKAHFIFEHAFQCEMDEEKQQFLIAEHAGCPIIFGDAAQIKEARVYNLKAKSYVKLPATDILIAGPSCTSRSRLNPSAAKNKGCVQKQKEATGLTFAWTFEYIGSRLPALVILENIKELEEVDEVGGTSDAEYVEGQLSKKGYHVATLTVDAMDFGAKCRRKRLYFVAIRKVATRADSDSDADTCRESQGVEEVDNVAPDNNVIRRMVDVFASMKGAVRLDWKDDYINNKEICLCSPISDFQISI